MTLGTASCATGGLDCRCARVFTFGFTGAVLLGVIIAGGLHHAVASGANVGIGIAIGVFVFGVASAVAFAVRSNKETGLLGWISIVGFAGSRNLRYSFKHNPKKWETYVHMVSFDFMIKYVCPPALLGAHPCCCRACLRWTCVLQRNAEESWLPGVIAHLLRVPRTAPAQSCTGCSPCQITP